MKKDHNYFLDISVKTQVKKVLFEFVYIAPCRGYGI